MRVRTDVLVSQAPGASSTLPPFRSTTGAMNLEELWKAVHSRFDPGSPPAERGWRVDRTDRSLHRIRQRLQGPFEAPRILLAGTVGSGKTTQMQRIAEERAGRDLVVLFDLQRHLEGVLGDLDALESVEAWEVAVLVGLAVGRLMADHPLWESKRLDELDKAWAALLPPAPDRQRVDLGKLLPALALQASKSVNGSWVLDTLAGALGAFSWDRRIGNARPGGVSGLIDQDPRIRRLLIAVNAILVEAQRLTGKRVLFCLDGLDRIRGRDRAVGLFLHSSLLGELACGLLVNAPFVLRHDVSLAEVRGFHPIFLVNEPVLDHADPANSQKHGPGIAFFERLFSERVQDLVKARGGRPLMETTTLQSLAWRSGGRAREFVLLVREAAALAFAENSDVITTAIVDEVTDQRRRLLESGLHAHFVEILAAVQKNPRAPLPDDPAVSELLQLGRLLAYPNESEWFFPHPLLLSYLDRSATA